MMMDPLTGAVCNPAEIDQLVDEYLVEEAEWLPQYAEEIERAKERWAKAVEEGTLIPPIVTEGAARLHTKTVEEMAADKEAARKNAAEADKAKERPAEKKIYTTGR
jgi:alpha-galactosidase